MSYNEAVEAFRDVEYPMMKDKCYLDHAGTTIYAKSLIDQFSQKMISNLYGNPHSASDPAQLSGQVVDSVREKALRYLGADPEHFDLVFTANATAAIKLVSESFRDLASASSTAGSFWYGYHKDAHTSLVGVREHTEGQHHCFESDREVEDWLNATGACGTDADMENRLGLFAYPGQSNMTGRRLPLSWTGRIRHSPHLSHQNIYSLLDAAALATATQLDFSNPSAAPDFVALSFYKIFGFPDLGALLVRKESGHILSWRRYFGGGTVSSVTVLHEATFQRKSTTIHDGLEDGTLPFHSIIALDCAIDVHRRLYGSMTAISSHTSFLSHRLYTRLSSLRYPNGNPLCTIYSDPSSSTSDRSPLYTNPKTQGSTIAFNVRRSDGTYIGFTTIERLANARGIFLRAGGLCNAGGISSHLRIEPWQFKRAWSAGHRCGEAGAFELIHGKPIGVVRASLGAMSTIDDVDTLIAFFEEHFIQTADTASPLLPEPTITIYHVEAMSTTQNNSTLSLAKIDTPLSLHPGWDVCDSGNDSAFVSGDETSSITLAPSRSATLCASHDTRTVAEAKHEAAVVAAVQELHLQNEKYNEAQPQWNGTEKDVQSRRKKSVKAFWQKKKSVGLVSA